MHTIKLDKPPRFLTQHILLRPDCLARLTLPTQLSQQDANRISALLDALVVEEEKGDGDLELDEWPFETDDLATFDEDDGEDPDGDLNGSEILASEEALKTKKPNDVDPA